MRINTKDNFEHVTHYDYLELGDQLKTNRF